MATMTVLLLALLVLLGSSQESSKWLIIQMGHLVLLRTKSTGHDALLHQLICLLLRRAARPSRGRNGATLHVRQQLRARRGILFLQRNLFDGAVLPANTELGLGHAVPRSSSTAIPTTGPAPPAFAYGNLENILAFYDITPGSERARKVAATLLFCRDQEQQQGESHVCAATLRAAMEFAAAALGTTPRAFRTVVHGHREPLRYVVAPNGITGIGGGGKVVPCHPLPYPADLLYCHRPGNVQAFRVELVGQDDPSLGATAIAVCHEKTDGWDPEYFSMLNGTRGEPVCHYMPAKYVLWVAASEM